MPIKHKTAPSGLNDILNTGLAAIFESRDASAPMGLGAAPDEAFKETHDASTPIPVYTVEQEDISNGNLLSAAKLIGWRVLILNQDTPVAASTVSSDESGNLAFGTLNQGPLVGRTVDSILASEASEAVANEDYELRYLEIRSLYFAAIWLYGDKKNILIPLEDNDGAKIKAHTEHSEEDILETLQELASRPGAIPQEYEDR